MPPRADPGANLQTKAGISAGLAGVTTAQKSRPAPSSEPASEPDSEPALPAEPAALATGVTDGWSAETRSEGQPIAAPESKPESTSEAETAASAIAAEQVAIATATDLRVAGDGLAATIELDVSVGVTAEVFTLANPYRVVIDLPDLAFEFDATKSKAGGGLVKDYRYGQFAEGKARVVIDTAGPVQITSATMPKRGQGSAVTLKITFAPLDAIAFGDGTGALRTAASSVAPATVAPPTDAQSTDAGDKPKTARARPLVVIDPGHGGIDPGAIGDGNVTEKSIVLDVARQLKSALVKADKFDVRMTRSSDVFISLDRRLKISQDLGADLFISLHADSIEATAAATAISGATVYTLSERASDEEARKRAEKENASDLIAGLQNTNGAGLDQVKNILIDLIKRETSNFSADFSNVVASRLAKSIAMSRDPQRSAAFKVLKQSHAPSVLIELGYMSNPADQRQMMTIEWQQKVAKAVTAAVVAYFSRRTGD